MFAEIIKTNKTIEVKIILTSEEKANALDEDGKRSSARVTYNKNIQIVDKKNPKNFTEVPLNLI